jgi:hypothetical protein
MMAKDNMLQPPEDSGADRDTDEWLQDHPELAPDESRISVDRGQNVDGTSIRRRADVGDIVGTGEESTDLPPGRGPSEEKGGFNRNDDYMGNEARISADADFSRGSGWLGGKLWGEDALGHSSGENTPRDEADPQGFQSSSDQSRNQAAIGSMGNPPDAGGASPEVKSKEGSSGDNRTQGRDLGNHDQATALQAFGRDIGSSGLPGLGEQEDEESIIRRRAAARQHSGWNAVLGKLGGSSPGSAENLQLAEKFNMVKFPSSREEVLQKLPPGSEFRIKDVVIDLREAVAECRIPVFRNTFDLIDCVKDAIRRAEKLQQNPV